MNQQIEPTIDTTQKNEESQQLAKQVKNGINISILLMVVGLSIGIYRTTTQLYVGAENPYGSLPWTITLIAISLISIYLCVRRRLTLAAYFLFATLCLVEIALAFLYQGAITSLSGMFTAFQIAILFMLVPNRQNIRNILLVFVVNSAILLADQFGSASRPDVPSEITTVLNLITIASLLVLIIVGVRGFILYSIRYKIFIAILAGSILSVIVIAISSNVATRQSIVETTGQNLKQLAEREAVSFGELIFQEVRVIQTLSLNQVAQNVAFFQSAQATADLDDVIASFPERDDEWINAAPDALIVRQMLDNRLSTMLLQFQAEFPNHVELAATDKYGSLLGITNKTSQFYQGDEEWWLAAYNGGEGAVYVGDPQFEESVGQYGIRIAVPIFSPNTIEEREVVGVLLTIYSFESLDELLALTFGERTNNDKVEFYLGDTFNMTLQPDGTVEIRELTTQQAQMFESYIRLEGSANLVDVVGDDIETQESLMSFAKVGTHEPASAINALNWHIVVLRAQEDLFVGISEQTRITILLSLAAVFASAVAAVALGQIITRPIIELTSTARRIEAGERAVRATVRTDDEMGEMAAAINSMMDELNESVEQRELRVSERTQTLIMATEIGRDLTSILDLDLLLQSVVSKVSNAFDFYHTQIYLWNEDRSRLVLKSGTGEAGRGLLAKEHSIEAGKGVVGKAAVDKAPIFVRNVRGAERPVYWLPNPLLPDTVSEAAVPIMVGNNVIGVLDVQDNFLGKMTNEDIDVLQIVVGQISVAIQNARLYTESQRKANNEAMISEINRKIQATTTVEAAMKTAVSELGKYMGTKTKITLGDAPPSNGTLVNGNDQAQ